MRLALIALKAFAAILIPRPVATALRAFGAALGALHLIFRNLTLFAATIGFRLLGNFVERLGGSVLI